MAFDGTDIKTGMISELGVRKETTFGSRNGAGTTVKMGDESSATFTRRSIQRAVGGIRKARQPRRYYEVGSYYEGEIPDLELLDVLPLYMALGKIATTGPVGGVYTHTVSPTGDDGTSAYLPSWTLEGKYFSTTPTAIELLGLTVRTLTLRIDLAEPLVKASMTYVARELGSTVSSPAEKTDIPYNYAVSDLKIDSDSATYVAGVSIGDKVSFNLSYDNAFEPVMDWNSGLMRQPFPGSLRDNLTGTLIRRYMDDDVVGLVGNTEFSMQLEMIRTADEDEIKIKLEHCLCRDLTRTQNRSANIENTDSVFNIGDIEAVSKDDDDGTGY